MKELDIDNTSFYSIPSISKTGSERFPEGPVKGVPGRVNTGGSGMNAISGNVPSFPKQKDAPENDPSFWNMGGNGMWWSVFTKE